MSATAQVVKTVYDDSSAEVQALIDILFSKWGAEDYRLDLIAKAKRVRPREQKKAQTLAEDLRDIWKACREDGTAPEVDEVMKMWADLQVLKKEIRKGQNKAKCGPKDRRVYSEAVKVYAEDERALLVNIRGQEIVPTKKLDPAILARIEERRKAKAAKSK